MCGACAGICAGDATVGWPARSFERLVEFSLACPPSPSDRGTLIDGTEFDSSYKRGKPTSFAPNQVIKGWTEAMQLMDEGDKWVRTK